MEANWERAHQELLNIANQKSRLDHEEATWLRVAHRDQGRIRLRFGYASYAEYVAITCGYSLRQSHERVRVALALGALPQLQRALEAGEVSWSGVRELSRVATTETEAEWLEAARGQSVRHIEGLVAKAEPGETPNLSKTAKPKRHTLRLEVSAETYATFREAVAALQKQAGGGITEEDALALMAREVLGGPKDEGRASYQIALTVCPECRRGTQQGRGRSVPVADEVVEMAECDCQHIGDVTHVGRATQDVPPATRRAVLRRDGSCVVPGCSNGTFLDLHHIEPRANGGGHEPDNLVCVCGAHHAGLHRGGLRIEGNVAEGLRFTHADGSAYGQPIGLNVTRVRADALSGLMSLGFKRAQAKAALEQVSPACGVPAMVKAALGVLHDPTRYRVRPSPGLRTREPRVSYRINRMAA